MAMHAEPAPAAGQALPNGTHGDLPLPGFANDDPVPHARLDDDIQDNADDDVKDDADADDDVKDDADADDVQDDSDADDVQDDSDDDDVQDDSDDDDVQDDSDDDALIRRRRHRRPRSPSPEIARRLRRRVMPEERAGFSIGGIVNCIRNWFQ
ncbi:hypothetical protein SDRG_05813 [Saprolegnia diclina VS20]|uniref:Uncharacterized protein n=1 Tax=Saprolegnia diclina (strain VS20) TaxID=1156394 RepID=T0QSN6_SAPDV|nr:hypothetical protein SDRG_05813 [Saprolegnia diclina VS20]EQC36995.1 hypothetical protein SDRG_05813 [Saprolegnia diclina VS20]|eukprot:XP_008609776.1 hypothetical protein SDRG_05813 [Saprolegnia diclina VS20]